MGRGLGHEPGGIRSLCQLLKEHAEAIRYDLLALGLRLDDLGRTYTWLDLKAVITQAPTSAAISRSLAGDDWWVTPELAFLRNISFATAWLVWAKSTDAQSGRNRPTLIPLTAAERRAARPEREKYRRRTVEETLTWLGWTKPSPN